jgi:glycosyltransferase involved in cell wall biosynthesis
MKPTPAEPKKLLICCSHFWPSAGGVEVTARQLAEDLIARGWSVTVLTARNGARRSRTLGGIVIAEHSGAAEDTHRWAAFGREIAREIESGGYDACLLMADPLNWIFSSLDHVKIPSGTRVVCQPLINEEGLRLWARDTSFFERLMRRLRRASAVTTLTEGGADAQCCEAMGVTPRFIPNAVPRRQGCLSEFRAAYGIPESSFLLLQVANFWPVKNHLRLLSRLTGMPGAWHLALVGNPAGDAGYLREVQESLGRQPRACLIQGLGPEEVASAMHAADLLLVPSLGEVAPLVVLEAMSHGLPWLATPECGSVWEHAGGIVAELKDFPSLICALDKNREKARHLGDLGRRHWQSSYTPEQTTSAWISVLAGDQATAATLSGVDPMCRTEALVREVLAVAGVGGPPVRRRLGHFGWTSCNDVAPTISPELEPVKDRPLVSVVVTTKDRPHLLVDALRSLVAQTWEDWEAVVVNDGGEDVEAAVSEVDSRHRIRYLRHPQSRGLPSARNTGINFSKGEVLCYLDDDDRLLPEHLETVVAELKRTGAEVVYTEAEYVAETLDNDTRVEHRRGRPYSGIAYSKAQLHVANFIPVNAVAHRRDLLSRTGTFDTSLTALEDWDLWIRFSRETDFVAIPRVTAEVRTRLQSGDEHMSLRRRKDFPALFRRIYGRYPVDFDARLEDQRRDQLDGLEKESQAAQRGGEYSAWIEKSALRESDAQYMAERMMLEWHSRPLFHLIVLFERGEEEALADTLDSLGGQLYQGWGLSVIAHAQAPEGIGGIEKLEWLTVDGDRLEAVNVVVAQTTAEWIMLLEPGVSLSPEALFSFGDYVRKFPDWRVVYSDEDRVGPDGERHDPLFKPDFNLDLLRSTPYMGGSIAIRREVLVEIGGYRPFGEATIYDLVFRALEAGGENSIGHVAKILFHRPDRFQRRRDEDQESAYCRAVVAAHLERVGVRAAVRAGSLPRTQTVEYTVGCLPKVSVIVPTRDQAALLEACVDSLLEITRYPDFEVLIVDNGSTEPAAVGYLQEIAKRDARVRVLRYDWPYSFSAINNFAAEDAAGEVLLLLNNDTQVLHDDWMMQMVGHAMRPEAGAVGARLVFPDGRIQHAGVVLGLMGTADHPGIGTPMTEPGYMGRLQVAQNFSAVTGACLMVRKQLYRQVGGLDGRDFNVLFNDVDFCLRLVKAGYKNVWTPQATLVHHASVSIKANADAAAIERARRERVALQERWGGWLSADPAFNRNLSLASQSVRVEVEISPAWDPTFRERPRVMAFPLDAQGTGHYRVWGPLAALDRAALAQFSLLPAHGSQATQVRVPNLPELLRAAPDTLLVQHGYLDLFLEWIERYRRHSRTFLVSGQDDNLLDVPDDNPLKKKLVDGLEGRMARAMGQCDRLIVTTPPLAEVYRRFIDDIRVVPNQLDGSRWLGLASKRRVGCKPRVGWAGALQHLGDLKWLEPVVRALHREVEWVFMGMCPDNLRPYVAEFHAPVPLPKYPAALAGLNLDLAIAPLEMNRFNEAKSDLRILEYGALGWPVIATDIFPYQGKPVTVLGNQPDRWVAAIRERVNDLDALALEGDRLREWVLNNRLLENNLDAWLRALFSDQVLREYGVLRALAA